MRPTRFLISSTLVVLFSLSTAFATERSEIPDRYKWDRTHLFSSDADWQEAKEKVEGRVSEIAAFEGRLGESSETLYEALSTLMEIHQDLDRVSTYASMLRDEDSRLSEGVEMASSARQIRVKLGTASSYIQPELIALGDEKVMGFVSADPRLEEYRTYLDDIVRWAPHTRNQEVEKVVAQARNLTSSGSSFHNTFTDAELPYPEITLSDGETVRLDASGYTRLRGTPKRLQIRTNLWPVLGAEHRLERAQSEPRW